MGERFLVNAQEAIRMMIKARGWTYKVFAEVIGTNVQNVIDKTNKRSSMSVALLLKYCEAADCELVIRSNLKDHTEWVITEPFRPEKGES